SIPPVSGTCSSPSMKVLPGRNRIRSSSFLPVSIELQSRGRSLCPLLTSTRANAGPAASKAIRAASILILTSVPGQREKLHREAVHLMLIARLLGIVEEFGAERAEAGAELPEPGSVETGEGAVHLPLLHGDREQGFAGLPQHLGVELLHGRRGHVDGR